MSFQVQFGVTNSENNRIEKDITWQGNGTFEGTLVDACSILNPVITFEMNLSDFATVNYMYIPQFKRWYYITNIRSINADFVEITGAVDVLYTYRKSILRCRGVLNRTEDSSKYNLMLTDNQFKVSSEPILQAIKFTGGNASALNTFSNILILGGTA